MVGVRDFREGNSGGSARGGWPLRVYVIGKDYRATEIDAADAARRFMAWLAEGGNPVLDEVIQTWLWKPPDAGGLGALAESGRDVAALRDEIAALWRRAEQCEPDGREAR
jgi:hypothetical protein